MRSKWTQRQPKSAQSLTPAAGPVPPLQAKAGPPLTEDNVVVTILFGTEYGFSKEIAEKLRESLREQPPYWWPPPPHRPQHLATLGPPPPCSRRLTILGATPRTVKGMLRASKSPREQVGLQLQGPSAAACRPRLLDMADHPGGLDLAREQALLVVCSTQVAALRVLRDDACAEARSRLSLRFLCSPSTTWL